MSVILKPPHSANTPSVGEFLSRWEIHPLNVLPRLMKQEWNIRNEGEFCSTFLGSSSAGYSVVLEILKTSGFISAEIKKAGDFSHLGILKKEYDILNAIFNMAAQPIDKPFLLDAQLPTCHLIINGAGKQTLDFTVNGLPSNIYNKLLGHLSALGITTSLEGDGQSVLLTIQNEQHVERLLLYLEIAGLNLLKVFSGDTLIVTNSGKSFIINRKTPLYLQPPPIGAINAALETIFSAAAKFITNHDGTTSLTLADASTGRQFVTLATQLLGGIPPKILRNHS